MKRNSLNINSELVHTLLNNENYRLQLDVLILFSDD